MDIAELDIVVDMDSVRKRDPIEDMFLEAFIQGVVLVIRYFRDGFQADDPEILEDINWLFDTYTNTALSFNWYCLIFSLEPTKVRNTVRQAIGM